MKMYANTKKSLLAIAACAAVGATAYAAIDIDEDGFGFVGKGDVQLALGMNNKALQSAVAAGKIGFTVESEVVTEVTWICTNSNNDNIRMRERTTTTTISGVLSSEARDGKNQFTGFHINGFDGDTEESTTSEGNVLNSCPSGPWSLTTPAGDPELVSSTGGLYVNEVLLD